MFEIFAANADWWLTAIFLILLLGPIGSFFLGQRRFRQQEIVEGLSTSALRLYLKTFYQEQATDPRAKFKKLYVQRFGWRRHIGALVVLTVVAATAAVWITASILAWTKLRSSAPGLLDSVSVAALAGAYAWVVQELITRWRFRDVSPGDLWNASWRLVLAVPLALAIGALFAKEVAVPIAFFLGSFPSRSVTTITRRLGRRTMKLGADADESLESELQKLQGVDTRIAERLADEGITTIVQLAYFDPIELTMRCASFSFSFIVDITSQALAHIYIGDKLENLRAISLRGAQEIASMIRELDEGDDNIKKMAKATITAAARELGIDEVSMERTLREIAADPFTEFLLAVWASE